MLSEVFIVTYTCKFHEVFKLFNPFSIILLENNEDLQMSCNDLHCLL
jgi:hypothetical protein